MNRREHLGPDVLEQPGDVYLTEDSWEQINQRVDDTVHRLAPGQVYIYHHGFLARDRVDCEPLSILADRFLFHGTPPVFHFGVGCSVNGTGLGRLTQVKIKEGSYLYTFRKGRRPQTTPRYY